MQDKAIAALEKQSQFHSCHDSLMEGGDKVGPGHVKPGLC